MTPSAPGGRSAAATRRRGRPRSEAARTAILRSAGALLLVHGLESISMDEVAKRAGASKATIYRWWPSKELLVLDALFSEWQTAPDGVPDTGSLQGDLEALLRPWARELAARPYGRVIAGLVSRAQNDPAFAEQYRARFVAPRRDQARIVIGRAIERGEIAAGIDTEVALDLLYAPFYHRVLHGHARVTPRFTGAIIDRVVTALTQAAPRRAPRARAARPHPGRA